MWLPIGSGDPLEETQLELLLDLVEDVSVRATGSARNPLAPTEIMRLIEDRGSWGSANATDPEVAVLLNELQSVGQTSGMWLIWDHTMPRGVRIVDFETFRTAIADRHEEAKTLD